MNHFPSHPLTSPAQDTNRASRPTTFPTSAFPLIAAAERPTSGSRASSARRSQLLGLGLLLLAGTAAHAKKVYYVSNTGSDSNNGTSAATPWKTIAKANTILASLGPSDQLLLQRGGTFRDDYIRCSNPNPVTAGMTADVTRPGCSGSASAPITIGAYGSNKLPNPILDAADPLSLNWTLVSGTTWEATVSGPMPAKLYVDGASSETTALLPVPNATGGYVNSATYNPYDLVSTSNGLFVRGPLAPSSGVAPTNFAGWMSLSNSFNGNTSQTFSGTNSGEQNVNATPGSWYGSGNRILVNLADGSNPNDHTFEGSSRPYGVVLFGVNYVNVQNLTIEHTIQSGIVSAAAPSLGTYFTGEHNRIINNKIWNFGSITNDTLSLGVHYNSEVAGIVVRAGGEMNPHLVQHNYIGGNYVGRMDTYFSVRNALHFAGIIATGIDGRGTSNDLVIEKNYVSTVNTRGIVYNNVGILSNTGTPLRNNGGRVSNNELVNNQGNIFFSSVNGGMVDHNRIHHSFGEGVQSGGDSLSSPSQPQTFAYNLIYHVDEAANHGQFNGFDCNGHLAGGYWNNNTVYDTYGASLTFEDGCTYPHVHNNIFDQDTLEFPAYKLVNASYLMYYVRGTGNLGPDFSNNVWVPGPQWHPFFGNHAPFNCATFFSAWPDKNSSCVKDPGFVDPDHGNFALTSASPAVSAAQSGKKAGAIQ